MKQSHFGNPAFNVTSNSSLNMFNALFYKVLNFVLGTLVVSGKKILHFRKMSPGI